MINEYVKTIKAIRVQKGISQSGLADRLGMTRTTYISVEQGKRELTISEFEKILDVFGTSFAEIESGQFPNYEKYKQMILAFLRQGKKLPKTKLAKLLYLSDFAWYYKHLQSMSGMQYRKIQYGPVPDSYFRAIDELYEDGKIAIDQTEAGAMLISETRTGAKVGLSEINKEEEVLIKSVFGKWEDKNTKEIVDFAHNQLPYLMADDNEIVSYPLITQENPDEVY